MPPTHREIRFQLIQMIGDQVVPSSRTLELIETEQVIGRSERADFVLPIPSLSRKHAAVWTAQGVPYIRDLGSQHGTFVNSVRIHETTSLKPGDSVKLSANLVFQVSQIEQAGFIEEVDTSELQITDSSLVDLALSHEPSGSKTRQYTEAFYTLSTKLAVITSPSLLLSAVLDELQKVILAERFLALIGDDPGNLTVAARKLADPDPNKPWNLPSKEIVRWAMSSDKPVISFDAKSDERFGKRMSVTMSEARSVICVGLRMGKNSFGAIYADNQVAAGLFSLEDGSFLQAVARFVALALQGLRNKTPAKSTEPEPKVNSPADVMLPQLAEEIANHVERLEILAQDFESRAGDKILARKLRAESQRLQGNLTELINPSEHERTMVGLGALPSKSGSPDSEKTRK